MARKSPPTAPLQLEKSSRETSPQIKTSPPSKLSPTSSFPKGSTIRPVTSTSNIANEQTNTNSQETENTTNKVEQPMTPGITAIPQYPPSPQPGNRHARDPSKSFFSNLKASRSTQRIHLSDASSGHSGEEKSSMSRGSSRDRAGRGLTQTRTQTSPKPDSPKQTDKSNSDTSEDHHSPPPRSASLKPTEDSTPIFNPPVPPPPSSSAPPPPSTLHALNPKKSKPRFGGLLARTRSIRVDDSLHSPRSSAPKKRPSNGLLRLDETRGDTDPPLKTAPLQPERTFRDVMGSTARNRSADRPATRDGSRNFSSNQNSSSMQHLQAHTKRERSHGSSMMSSVASSSLFHNIKNTSSGAADRIGKAGKGFFGKIARSGSSHEREVVPDDNYVCSVINLPLVEQTRRTRMVKSLRNSKDKTEFWMPALPWRCIDYLNFKGCEEEGLYRVPGSGKEVKHWQRRFDTELDINLFDEPDLYDINTIGSMFKAWLRCLPDEILPKATQAKIAAEAPGATTAPQLLKDELSKLPPYNYYLLFTITCHLSLLHSYVDKNKMDYRNLFSCLRLEELLAGVLDREGTSRDRGRAR
ncbi:Rho GTPase activator Bem2 [Arthroderma uncinatum]|uniref:Rho GTPase activator Bem2 n=1 Tax=Arthroderma uncinatum TaxID=74035 RepID=UPI00144AA85D|nr:Rho GTPase activator Bem2 [Arthroderma uncinatum]KAF3481819.1 Rho GTPase activator Bem2 [Arthroderma uncinatum]